MGLGVSVQFGHFRFDPAVPVLMAGSSVIDLPRKALEILAVLVSHAGRVVLKEDLLDLVWPDAAVEEGNIAVHISSLRRALGESRESRSPYIETIPKRGYRFAASVQPLSALPASRTTSGPAALARLAAHYMHLFTADGCCRAEALLRRLRELSPDSARIRTTFAETLLVQCMLRLGNQEESRARASSLLAEAAEIDPDCAFVYIDRALWCSAAEWRWDQAEDDTRGAVDIAKDVGLRHLAQTSLGLHLIRRGNLEYGTRELPSPDIDYLLPPIVWLGHAGARFLARDFQRSVEVLNQALTLYPNHWFLNLEKGKALAALQDYSGALRSLRRARFLYEGPNPNLDAEIAHVKALSGKRESAISLLSRAQALSLSGVDAARLHSVLGSSDAAITFLEEACAERDLSLGDVKQDYRFDRLRSDPRFRSALNRVGV